MKPKYDIQFVSGYRIVVSAENMQDGITLGKAEAIKAGHTSPKLSTITLENGSVIYFCSVCGNIAVNSSEGEDTCYSCLRT